MTRARTAILISGRGSNMMALVEAARAADFPAEVVCVVSNRADAKGLEFAAANGIATRVIDHKAYPSREAFEAALDQYLRSMHVEAIALAGFMRVITAQFISGWDGRILNIHPSLLPAYKGLHTHERAIADGAKVAGCSVHLVTPELDGGPVLLQAEVSVLPGDTPDTLAARVLEQEHRIYPQALAWLANRIIEDRE
ncbi:phosphoribosylglycinamide formyltransferase [Aestuariivirga litoralis]|uniref:Phosphoribosylglycinamide formyltransferase n=1 Tax=Aestuariivirga litoralis TaxID=2650924 RepID=A0A2W2AJD9_9HYPH|nr:phosphoribosylglycinamide formyltransferase [Aestuariivirga litoralis]PZF75411.1 phosphoribosylglycinamide formyltransferase [Aestuariivirga litoralis]